MGVKILIFVLTSLADNGSEHATWQRSQYFRPQEVFVSGLGASLLSR